MDKPTPSSRRDKSTNENTPADNTAWNRPGGRGNGPADGARSAGRSGSGADKPAGNEAERARGDTSAAYGEGANPTQSLQEAFLDDRDDVLSVINELEDQLDRYQEIRTKMERELTAANEQVTTANQRIQELEWQNVAFQTRVDALEQVRQEITILEEQISDANNRASRSVDQLGQIEKENARLEGELKTANKQLEEFWTVRKERDGLRADMRNARGRLEELERVQRDGLEERAQLQSRVQEMQIAVDENREIRHKLEQDLRAANDRANEVQRANKAIEDKLDTLRNEKKALQAQLTHLERENARLAEQRQFYETELSNLRSSNRQAEAGLASIKKAFAEVRIALAETRSRARRRTTDTWARIGTGDETDADARIVESAAADAGNLPRADALYGNEAERTPVRSKSLLTAPPSADIGDF